MIEKKNNNNNNSMKIGEKWKLVKRNLKLKTGCPTGNAQLVVRPGGSRTGALTIKNLGLQVSTKNN